MISTAIKGVLIRRRAVAADVTAPTLSSPSAGTPTSDGATSAGVSTNEGNGTLYWAAVTDGGSCTDAQLKAGSGGNIVAGKAGSQAVSGTGAQTIATITGLTAATTYQIKYLHRDAAGNDSSQSSVSLTTAAGAGDPSFSSVVALLHLDGTNGSTTFTDQKGHTITSAGNAQISTTNSKFGTGCYLGDGAGDYITCIHSDFVLGTGDFTLEMFVRPTSLSGRTLYDSRVTSPPDGFAIVANTDGSIYFYVSGPAITAAAGSFVTGTYKHFAVCRASGNTRVFIEGTQSGITYADSNNYTSDRFAIGANRNTAELGLFAFDGRVDEFRLTKGVARYTGNFTAPIAAFPDS